MKHSPTLQRTLQLFLLIPAVLIILGLIFIYSASSIYALERCNQSYFYVKKQFFGLLIGSCCFVILSILPANLFKKVSPLLFIGSLGLTFLTLVPSLGMRIHGSSRWLNLFGFSFQPSELLKLTYIVYLAYLLEKKERRATTFMSSYFPFLLILGATCLLMLKQPDFGTTVTLATTTIALLFIAHIPLHYLVVTLASVIPIGIALIYYKPYRMHRILTFLNPWADPQGAGFQIIQSLIAIGSGSMWGLGITQSKQKFFYLPMQHTDFIFAIIAEETGFIGSLFIISLYILFLYCGIRIAWHLKQAFGRYVTLGFVLLINLQALINLAVATGIAPTKGTGLPFISYGNTALICNLCMLGIIVNCVHSDH